MLMMDRIVKINDHGGEHGKGEILAELDITPDLWFFDCHFPGDPVMPGCLGLDAMWQLVGFFLGWKGVLARDVRWVSVKSSSPARSCRRPRRSPTKSPSKRVINRKLVMGIADGVVEVDGRPIYSATDLKVGLFKDTTAF